MVYESDFYTTRRPYRSSPAYSTYTVSSLPSRQIRVLPGLGKVHIVHTYDRIVPYVGHKRLTVVTSPPKVYATRPSILQKEYDWIESKVRPWVAYSPTNRYLNSRSAVRYVYVTEPITGLRYPYEYVPSVSSTRTIVPLSYSNYWPYYKSLSSIYDYWLNYPKYSYDEYASMYQPLRLQRIFDDETKLIRAQTASLLKQIHLPVPKIRSWGITPLNRYGEYPSLPVKYSNDTYIHRLLTVSPNAKISYATYYTEPVKKYIGDKSYNRRQPLTLYEDTLKNDIHLLSFYINKFRQEKSQPKEIKAPLPAARPSRIFSVHKPLNDPVKQEIKDLREERAARLAKIYESDQKTLSDVEKGVKSIKEKEETRRAEEKAILEEQKRKELQAKKEAEARKAELARQEQLAAQAAAERALELEKQAEKVRQEELKKQVEIARARELEEQERLEAEARAEEERQQLLRLEEIARQAEEEKEAELARQAEELAELAKQEAEQRAEEERQQKERVEAELTELKRQQEELAELARQEEELAELARQEAELAELDNQGAELAELAKQEAELAEKDKQEAELAELARQEAELAELEKQEAELAELAKQEAELAELAKQEAELAELARQEAELAELARQDAELAELEKQAAELAGEKEELDSTDEQPGEKAEPEEDVEDGEIE